MHDHAIQCVHDPILVTLSYLVAVLGSYTALQLAIAIPLARDASERLRAVFAAGAVMGGGAIWAMHFIAMLACAMPVTVEYDLVLTVLSAVVGMVSCMAGLAIASGGVMSWGRLSSAGVLMGLGVAGMHYVGMGAMVMPATTHYDVGIVALSVLIAVVASIAALWLAFNMRGTVQMVGSALVMGVAVCGMHYVGMTAATFEPVTEVQSLIGGPVISGAYLGMTIFVVTVLLLTSVLSLSIARGRRRAMVQI